MALELRPLDFGDRIGAAFKLYGANLVTLITIVAIVMVPVQLLVVLLGWLFARDFPLDPETGFIDVDAIEASDVVGWVVLFIVLAIISFVGTLLATGGVMKAIADDALGNDPDWQDSLRFALSKLGPLALGSILYGLGLAGVAVLGVIVLIAVTAVFDALGAVIGAVGLFVAIVYLAVSWSIWVPAVLVEGKSATEALGRSLQLIKGRWWPTFGYLLVIYILVGLINGVAGGALLALVSEPIIESVINIVLTVLTTPITAAAVVVLYFDQRVRNEGFTVEDLAAHLDAAGDDPFGSLPPAAPPTGDMPPMDSPPDDTGDDPSGEGWPSPDGI